MGESWNQVLAAALRPERPELDRCRRIFDAHIELHRRLEHERTRAIADCHRRIDEARGLVFAAGDGVVPKTMGELENEYRRLARAQRDDDFGVKNLWAAVAPGRWVDRPRWTAHADVKERLSVALTLASDPDGVDRAEASALELAASLSGWGTPVGDRVSWRVGEDVPFDAPATKLFVNAVRAAYEALDVTDRAPFILQRCAKVRREVLKASRKAALNDSECGKALGREIAQAALIDFVWNAAAVEALRTDSDSPFGRVPFSKLPNPVAPLVKIWKTGYFVSSVSERGVVLGAVPVPVPNEETSATPPNDDVHEC